MKNVTNKCSQLNQEVDQKQLKTLENRFVSISQSRLDKMLASYNLSQSDSIKLLQLLFHVNHAMLPGYVDKSTPCGIPNYSPTKLEKKIAKTISRSFEFKSRAYLKFEIAALYLMGSTGTLGQSNTSDLDLWVCITEKLDVASLNKLQKKMQGISAWIQTRGIELNCYLVEQDDFKKKQQDKTVGNLKVEPQKASLSALLLDEFYRTAVWLCGRRPLWWLIPLDKNHEKYATRLLKEKHLESADWIDFGAVNEIPPHEYFNAALWQQYKAINSPYKSTLKLLILEVYARHVSETELLSTKFKSMVHQGTEDQETLDPYIMLLTYTQSFLYDKPERLEFLRRAFYLKTGIKIQLNKNKSNWRYQQMQLLVKGWQWNQSRLDYLNQRYSWRINTVLKESQNIIREITHSYHFISDYARMHGVLDDERQQELVTLGRKLHAVFEKKLGKIELVNHGVAKNIIETSITLYQKKTSPRKNQQWHLLLGSVSKDQLSINPTIYKSESLFEILAWCVCNQLINKQCNYQLYSDNNNHHRVDIKTIVNNIFKVKEKGESFVTEKDFESEPKTIKLGIFINTEGLTNESLESLSQYSTSKGDVLRFGEQKVNLINHIDVFYISSWREYSVKHYKGPTALIELFVEHRESLIDEEQYEITTKILPDTLKQRLHSTFVCWEKLANNSQKFPLKLSRYFLSIEIGYLVVDFFQGKITYQHAANRKAFLYCLSEIEKTQIQYHIDPYLNLENEIIRLLNKPKQKQHDVYLIQINKNRFEVLIISPLKEVFYNQHMSTSIDKLLCQYQQFFDSLNQRAVCVDFLSGSANQFQFHYLDLTEVNKNKRFRLIQHNEWHIAESYCRVQAIATTNSKAEICFDLHVNDRSYYYRDYGELVYRKLCQFIMQQRKDAKTYGLFITDLDLSLLQNNFSLINNLQYKRQIELKINHTMRQLNKK